MGGKVGNYLNPVKAFTTATKDLAANGKLLLSGKAKPRNFMSFADDLGSLGLAKNIGLEKAVFGPEGGNASTDPNAVDQSVLQFDPEQTMADQQSIRDLANKQYGDYQNFSEAERQKLTDALIQASQHTFQQGLPGTMEDLNARHLLNGSGLGQEIARQQGNIATNIADQVGTNTLALDAQAFQGRQAQEAAALSRGLSLQDFARQAQVAKAIGASAAPAVPSGKSSGISAGLAGAGTGFTVGGPWGAAIGGGLGYLGGSQAYGRGGK